MRKWFRNRLKIDRYRSNMLGVNSEMLKLGQNLRKVRKFNSILDRKCFGRKTRKEFRRKL